MKQYAKVTPEGSRDLLFEECDDRRRVEIVSLARYPSRTMFVT